MCGLSSSGWATMAILYFMGWSFSAGSNVSIIVISCDSDEAIRAQDQLCQ